MTRGQRKLTLNKLLLRISWVGLLGLVTWAAQAPPAVAARDAAQTRASKRGNIVRRTGLRVGAKGTQARRLLALHLNQTQLRLIADGAIKRYEIIELRNPARLVIDLHYLRRAQTKRLRRHMRSVNCDTSAFKQMRFGRHPHKLRIVLDACQAIPTYRVRFAKRSMSLQLNTKAHGAPARSAPARGPAQIADIGFGEDGTHTTLLLRVQGAKPSFKHTNKGLRSILDLPGTSLAKGLQRSLNTSSFQGAVQRIRAIQRPDGARIIVDLKHAVANQITHHKGDLKWQFAMPTQKVANHYQIKYNPQRVGQAGVGQLSPSDMALMSQKSGPKRYTGRRISVIFDKVDIHNLLRLFAEISGMNIITSGKVSGKLTLKLRNVPWDQALELVLKTLKLGMERSGNIVRIATLTELREEEEQRAKLMQLRLLAKPQKIRLIPVNYAKASDMAAKIKNVLSPRGKISIDNRTNVLIVKDYREFLLRAEGLVKSLDTQTPQVLIQARIVEANVNFSREFGIQWGGHLLFSPLTGNSTGLQFPNPVGIRGGVPSSAGGQAQAGTGEFGTPNYLINFPATTGVGQGTALSFLFGSLSGVGSLQMRLSAAESTGNVKIISAPKIITLHKMSASIQQGLQIPFSSASAAGTNVQFVTASLSLTVLPQVTTDGSVFLTLNISNNAPDFSKGGSAGPAITTKTAQTNMLIKDGETMVIGGIYSRRTGSSQSRVPFLSQIPVLGLLFKNYKYNDDRAELLVFVTPRIINRAQTLGGKQGS